jgi:two-component system nitrate/nitrite response regulator NarL
MGTSTGVLRVLLVGEDPLARAGLAALLQRPERIEVVGQIASGDGVEESLDAHHPHVVLWDLGFAVAPDLDAMRRLARRDVAVVAVAAGDAHAAAILNAGARGVLLRDGDEERLVASLAAVAEGLIVMDPVLKDAALRPSSAPEALVEPLTPRESEVLALLAQGLANKTIADRLGISEHTAKFHVNAILGKLGAESRTEAIVQAIRLGLVVL